MKLKVFLATLKMSDPLAMMKIAGDWRSAVRLHFLYAARQSGLLEALEQPRTSGELIERLGVQRPEILDALLQVGLSVGELGFRHQRYRLKGRRARALARPSGDPLSAVLEASATYYNRIYRHTAQRLKGGPDYDRLGKIGELVARFSALAESMICGVIADGMPRRRAVRVLDVGCGSGIYLNTAASLNPQATGIGLEVDPQVAAKAEQNLVNWGIEDRFSIICGTIGDGSLEGEFELITLFNVVYYLPDEERPAVFRAIKQLLGPGGRFVLVNSMQSGGTDFGAANLNLAVSSMVGCTPLPDRHRLIEQLGAAGFENIVARKLASQNAFWAIAAR